MAESHKETELKGVPSFKTGTEAVGTGSEEQRLVVTIDSASGRIVRVEKLDTVGNHHEFKEENWASLVGEDEIEEMQSALDEAFEAGIAGVLGDEYEEDEPNESDEQRALRRLLIGGLVRRSVRRRILQRLVLSRLLRRGSPKTNKARILSP